MDPFNSAARQGAASARQRLKNVWERSSDRVLRPTTARKRHTQRPTGGGLPVNEGRAKWDDPLLPGANDTEQLPGLRDILQSGAATTKQLISERMRQASKLSQDFSHKLRDPQNHPTTWIVEPSLGERLKTHIGDAMPFAWRERARRRGYWRRRVTPVLAILLGVAFAFTIGYAALENAGHAAGALSTNQPQAQSTAGGSVMISPLNGIAGSPTPTLPQYSVGVWVSDTLPQGGSVTVFVRVSNNAQPQPGAKVSIQANTPNGTINLPVATTDSFGVASATLNFGNVGPVQPIYLTATTTINGQTASGDYTFVTY